MGVPVGTEGSTYAEDEDCAPAKDISRQKHAEIAKRDMVRMSLSSAALIRRGQSSAGIRDGDFGESYISAFIGSCLN